MSLIEPGSGPGSAAATPDAAPVLRLVGIRKSFEGTEVLRGIDLTVHRHEIVALIGASGSGKSTLLRTANLLEQIDDGQIFLGDDDISDPRAKADRIRSRIGVVFQHFNLFPHLSVLDNVTLASRAVHRASRAEAERRGLELLDSIGLADKAREFPDRLSGGQQQRAAIVRSIATDPELLLLDEITSALDPELVGEVLDLVRELGRGGTTILMATHEMAFARDVAHRVVFLDKGVVAEAGPPAQLFEHSENPRTREFLARFTA
ncbi:MAG: amino acid ABC transporter ATP-binding protein [Leifsonia flava]